MGTNSVVVSLALYVLASFIALQIAFFAILVGRAALEQRSVERPEGRQQVVVPHDTTEIDEDRLRPAA